MRPPVVASIAASSLVLLFASFSVGRFSERRAQQLSTARAKQLAAATSPKTNRLQSDGADENDHILVANVATVSFAELWDVLRAGAPAKRAEWAHEVKQLPPGTRRNAALKSFYKIWAELDPIAALNGLEEIQDKRMQSPAFDAAADAAADSALPAFAELQSRLGYRTNSFSGRAILARWAAADPPGVAQFLETHPQTNAGFFMDVTYNWANSDPEKAAEWFTNLKMPAMNDPRYPRAEDRRRLEAARGLLEAWVEKDTRGAAAFAATRAQDPDITKALGEFTGALFIKSHDQAAAFILSLPDENSQRAALTEISNYIGGKPFILREGGDDEEPEDPEIPAEDVPAWLVSLPPNVWIDKVGEIFQGWSQADSAGAEGWLRSLPSDMRSKAIVNFAGSASAEQAPRVFELITLIEDANSRRGALGNFVANLSDNPLDARNKIAHLSITDRQKQILLRLITERQ